MAELTPMKQQYYEIKHRHNDCLLFFRLGDFYEMFDDDAKLASKELDLALTTRDRGIQDPEKRTPMCGVPYHSAQSYIAKLVAKGYKVAICEQIEDPATAKGLVKRDVIKDFTTIWMDSIRDGAFELSNTNKLVHRYPGCTGLKTGYTSASMYCLSATAERDGVEYIAVVMHFSRF